MKLEEIEIDQIASYVAFSPLIIGAYIETITSFRHLYRFFCLSVPLSSGHTLKLHEEIELAKQNLPFSPLIIGAYIETNLSAIDRLLKITFSPLIIGAYIETFGVGIRVQIPPANFQSPYHRGIH